MNSDTVFRLLGLLGGVVVLSQFVVALIRITREEAKQRGNPVYYEFEDSTESAGVELEHAGTPTSRSNK